MRFALPLILAAASAAQAAPAPLPASSVYQLAAPLTDQSGRKSTLSAKRGQPQLVVMFYTACKSICPAIIDTVLDLDRKLTSAEKARFGVLLISLDPQRDDPGALLAVATQRRLDLTRWTLAQPRVADLRAIAGVLGVRYRALADGDFNHTGVLVLLDAEGRSVARSEQTNGRVDPQFLSRVHAALTPRPSTAAPEPTPASPVRP